MQFILDNLIATVVGVTVLLILGTSSLRSSSDAVSATSYQALVTHSNDFREVVSRDIRSLSEVISVSEEGESYSFKARVTPGDTTAYTVEYRKVEVGNRAGEPLYEIRRYVDGEYDGASPSLIKSFTLEARESNGALATSADAADRVFVRVETATPHELPEQQYVETSVWEAILFPPSLRL